MSEKRQRPLAPQQDGVQQETSCEQDAEQPGHGCLQDVKLKLHKIAAEPKLLVNLALCFLRLLQAVLQQLASFAKGRSAAATRSKAEDERRVRSA